MQVTITDATGVACEAIVTEQDDDSIDLRISDMTRGQDYTVTVSGVRLRGEEAFGVAQTRFTAN